MFCLVQGRKSKGIGKLIRRENMSFVVEYFDSPNRESLEEIGVLSDQIIKIKLAPTTQIYYWNPKLDKWHLCTVIEDFGNEILVESKLNSKRHKFQDYENLYVRCSNPILDASEYLANSLVQHPKIAELRSTFLKQYIKQKNNAWGISALLSSVIELEKHQIRVVRRVLADPSQRYLLADEVGLGKTIEAGVIIRQAVLDDPEGHKILVLTPFSLLEQWKEELITRFGLEHFLNKSIFILPHEYTQNLKLRLGTANMLVIDEAHKISRSGTKEEDLYVNLSMVCHKLKRLLLLSATPIASDQIGFLRMLHLLDPVVYNLHDIAGFKHKVDIRLQLGEIVAGLDLQNIFFIDSSLDQLLKHLPEDSICLGLVKNLRSITNERVPDANDPIIIEAVDKLKAHLSETYKLDRRILRNRRSRIQISNLRERSGGEIWEVNSQVLLDIENLFETWRINNSGLIDHDVENIFSELSIKIIRSIIEYDYEELNTYLLELKFQLKVSEQAIFIKVNGFLDALIKLTSDGIKSDQNRLFLLAQNTIFLIRKLKKIVIFCSNKSSADNVYNYLLKQIPRQVIRHDRSNRSAWNNFGNDDVINVIVCDQYAEEGLNFQGGDEKILIHYDLPFEPQRIEQRIGRLDRYGATSNVKSVIIIDNSSLFQKSYYRYLSDALGIFDTSITEIQYLVEQNVNNFKEKLFIKGLEAIEDSTNYLIDRDLVVKERKNVHYQDELNTLSDTVRYEDLNVVDDTDGIDFYESFNSWVEKALGLETIVRQVGHVHDYMGLKFRYKLNNQVYKTWSDSVFQKFEYSLSEQDWESPGSFQYSNNRTTAIHSKSRHLRLLRYGDPLVEAVVSLMSEEDRGRTSAIWRKIEATDQIKEWNSIYFSFEFLAQTNLDGIDALLRDLDMLSIDAKQSLERRANSLFPNLLEKIWIDEEGDEVIDTQIVKLLNQSFDESCDTTLNINHLKLLSSENMGQFSNWEDRIYLMRDKAKAIFLSRLSLNKAKQNAYKQAMDENRLREAQLTIREHLLHESEAEHESQQMLHEMKINKFLFNGFDNPSINIESATAIYISSSDYPLEDK